MLLEIIKSIFCQHKYEKARTLQGEQIYHFDAVTEWQCIKCKKVTYSGHGDRIK
ncbi:MAG: hypothetical protein H9855_12840 [Candidatus Acinetobacter avistercoris]|nr:hypothetical protein [Candidatus Acinetobacter avistercoris]